MLRAAARRLTPVTGALGLLLVAGFVASGGYIYWNTNVRNPFETRRDREARAAAYERTYKPSERAPHPRITHTEARFDLSPESGSLRVRGRLSLVNQTAKPIEQILVGLPREAVLCAWGITEDGRKVLRHLAPGTKEDTASCTAFFEDLKRRGLADPLLTVTDGAPGLIREVETCFPRALRQRCLVHRLRNLRSKPPDGQWPEIAIRARACYEAASPALAALLRDDFVQAYQRELPALVQCFLDDFEACIAHLRFPLRHRKVIRTTNLLERLFVEERRRTKIIPHAFGERPVLKLMYAAIIRAADRWRGITIGEFEQRQLKAIREELDRAHTERVRPAVRSRTSASPVKLSSKVRT